MKTRWWEPVVGVAGLFYTIEFAVEGHVVRSAIAAAIFLWIVSRVLPRYTILGLFLRSGLRRWRLGPRPVLRTIALGARMNRLFTPALAARRLQHSRVKCGWAYGLFLPVVGEAAAAHAALRRLSFYETADTLALAHSLESLRDLGAQLDRIDASLVRSSGGTVRNQLQVAASSVSWTAADAVQSSLEGTLARRSGADGEWFRRVIGKRREVLHALRDGQATMRRMKHKAVWMLERQRETGLDDELELVDVGAARNELREAADLVAALAEGVGEVHLGTTTRL